MIINSYQYYSILYFLYDKEMKQNSWFQIPAYVMDGYYVNRSVCTCLSISSFLAKEPRPDIMTSRETFLFKTIDCFTSKKLLILFFFVFFYFHSNCFFMFVWKNTKNLIAYQSPGPQRRRACYVYTKSCILLLTTIKRSY